MKLPLISHSIFQMALLTDNRVCVLTTPDGNGHFYIQPFIRADRYREHVMGLELVERPRIVVFGKEGRQNRNVGFFSDESKGYKYSRQMMASSPLTPELKKILTRVNRTFQEKYNGILVNRYVDGNDYIGKHKDDESGLGDNGVVGIVYGATRKLRIRDSEGKIVEDLIVSDGYMYQMDSEFNRVYTHEIPVEKRVKGERISLTFRHHTE